MLKYHIQTIEVGATTPSSISFNSIPQIYDDLLLVLSGRSSASGQPSILYRFNGSSSGYSSRILAGYTSGVTTGVPTTLNSVNAGGDWGRLDYEGFNYSASTSNTFSNIQFYVPNYRDTTAKISSAEIASEDINASPLRWWLSIIGAIWSGTQPINSVSFALYEGSFAQYSSISLYGIRRGIDRAIGTSPIATGGTVTTSGGYTYHTFTSSGTFVANRSLSIDALVVGGGGGGGGNAAGGGGGGGFIAQSLNLVPSSYTVTVGAGGAAGTGNNNDATSGGLSSAFGFAAIGGGRGAGNNTVGPASADSGGSGGGGSANNTAAGSGTPGQGSAGGTGLYVVSPQVLSGGGGGGASQAGANASSTANNGGSGGFGSLWSNGQYYAGGGGGGRSVSGASTPASGGIGGGGNGGYDSASPNSGVDPTAGTANTGGGGGGAAWGSSENGAAGGSGVVIIRYLTPA